MESTPPTPQQRVRAWLAVHLLAIAGTALVCLCLFYLLSPHNQQVLPQPTAGPLSRQQTRQAIKAQTVRLDSINRELQKLPALTRVRDSALAVARRQNAHADHLLILLKHEASSNAGPVRTQSAERLARALAAYQPGTYALDSAHSVR